MIGLLKLTKSIYSLFLYYEKHRGAATAAGVEPPESVHPPACAGTVHFFGISNIGTHGPLRGPTFLKHAPFLTGSSGGLRLRHYTDAPQTDSSATANGKLQYRYPKILYTLKYYHRGTKRTVPFVPLGAELSFGSDFIGNNAGFGVHIK